MTQTKITHQEIKASAQKYSMRLSEVEISEVLERYGESADETDLEKIMEDVVAGRED